MITGPNNNALGKYVAESKAGKATAAAPASETQTQELATPAKNNSANPVNFSREAQMLQQLETELNSYPSVDSEKIESIKNQLASGGYNINTSSVASKIMLLDSLY